MMTKKEVEMNAAKLGINLEGMTWQQKVSTVAKAMVNANKNYVNMSELEQLKRKNAELEARNKELSKQQKDLQVAYMGYDDGRPPTREELLNIPIEIASPIGQEGNKTPMYVFNEDVGYDVNYKEENYIVDGVPEGLQRGKSTSGTFTHLGYKQNKVTATTGAPLRNAGLILLPNEMFWTVYTKDIPTNKYWLWADVKHHLMQIDNGTYLGVFDKEIHGDGRTRGQLVMIMNRYAIPKIFVRKMLRQIKTEEERRKNAELY